MLEKADNPSSFSGGGYTAGYVHATTKENFGGILNIIKARKYFLTSVLLLILALLSGCGSGGGSAPNNDPSVSLVSTNGSVYAIKASNFTGVAGMEITINYSSTLSSPTVTQGQFISGALMAANTNIPGTIKIAVISTGVFSGTGEIATVSFVNANSDAGTFPTVSAKLYDVSGKEIP